MKQGEEVQPNPGLNPRQVPRETGEGTVECPKTGSGGTKEGIVECPGPGPEPGKVVWDSREGAGGCTGPIPDHHKAQGGLHKQTTT